MENEILTLIAAADANELRNLEVDAEISCLKNPQEVMIMAL